jgi:hypothetical protein
MLRAPVLIIVFAARPPIYAKAFRYQRRTQTGTLVPCVPPNLSAEVARDLTVVPGRSE